MEVLTFDEIINAVNGEVYIRGQVQKFIDVSTDTRKINSGSIFIALKGENFNGNEFVSEAIKKGAYICIVDEIKFAQDEINKDVSIIKVKDTKRALLDLAAYYRSILNIKVIGITGSTGKTSTKDLTAAVLSSKLKVFKTQGNFNNEIGLPLMIFKIDSSYDAAVLEMGMSNLGEIHNLSEVAKPDIAIITNVGISHIENLKTRENILKAKMEIVDYFSKKNVLIINADNDLLKEVKSDKFKVIKIGTEGEVDYKADNIILGETSISFDIKDLELNRLEKFNIDIPGKHNILNSMLALATGIELGLNYSDLRSGIKNLESTSMRLDIIKGEKFIIIDDCYNASPDSMIAAIDVLKNLNGKRKVAILGTMKELGEKAYEAHLEIGKYVKKADLDLLITVGEYNKAYAEGFNNDYKYIPCEKLEDASKAVLKYVNEQDVILIKASRTMHFEKIVNELKEQN